MPHHEPPDLSVIVPCHRAAPWIVTCLDSLQQQTLTPDRFEVVLVFNGPDDGARALAEEVLSDSPLRRQLLHGSVASAGAARNVAVAAARGQWTTFLDVDDRLSPEYVEQMLAAAEPGFVPVADLIDIDEITGEATPSPVGQKILAQHGDVSPARLWAPLTMVACKLIETDLLRNSPFDETLRSGEDVALFPVLFDRHRLMLRLAPAHAGAVYQRVRSAGSVSRQAPSFDFSVTQRLAVIRHLDAARHGPSVTLGPVFEQIIRSQAAYLTRYLARHPEHTTEVIEAVRASGVRPFPWDLIRRPTDRLAICYNYPPFADPSALVSVKRLLASGELWNVISCDMSRNRSQDPSLAELTGPCTAQHRMVAGPAIFAGWPGLVAFCDRGWKALDLIETTQGPQRILYSRALWPASHLLAASVKGRRGEAVWWEAEFSDPIRKDIHGHERAGSVAEGPWLDEFRAHLRSAGVAEPPVPSPFAWVEHLAYALADTLVFTNPHQLSYMLSYLEDERLAELVRRKAVIQPQPQPPEWAYRAGVTSRPIDRHRVHIGYFGSFYPTRSLTDVLAAVAALPEPCQDRITLHLFSAPSADLTRELDRLGRPSGIVVERPLPYLDFLATVRTFDVLLVNDAVTADHGFPVNPYLPSKLSDYLGSERPLWVLYEPGSMLSRTPAAYRSRVGDAEEVREVLLALATAKEGHAA